jgi:hypothetical protein
MYITEMVSSVVRGLIRNATSRVPGKERKKERKGLVR